MGGMTDQTGQFTIRKFSHVRICHPRHSCYSMTGTVVLIDIAQRKVWVSLPDGRIVPAGHRSIQVIPANRSAQ